MIFSFRGIWPQVIRSDAANRLSLNYGHCMESHMLSRLARSPVFRALSLRRKCQTKTISDKNFGLGRYSEAVALLEAHGRARGIFRLLRHSAAGCLVGHRLWPNLRCGAHAQSGASKPCATRRTLLLVRERRGNGVHSRHQSLRFPLALHPLFRKAKDLPLSEASRRSPSAE